MENDLSVALMLWAPLGLVLFSLGLQFRKDVSAQKAGKVVGLIGLVFFGVSFITVPESPSAASSALLVSLLPSVLLMSIGPTSHCLPETFPFEDSHQKCDPSVC